MGIEIELEHTDDREIAKKIALDHLAEIPDYYTRLKKMEDEAGIKEDAKQSPSAGYPDVQGGDDYNQQDTIDSRRKGKVIPTKPKKGRDIGYDNGASEGFSPDNYDAEQYYTFLSKKVFGKAPNQLTPEQKKIIDGEFEKKYPKKESFKEGLLNYKGHKIETQQYLDGWTIKVDGKYIEGKLRSEDIAISVGKEKIDAIKQESMKEGLTSDEIQHLNGLYHDRSTHDDFIKQAKKDGYTDADLKEWDSKTKEKESYTIFEAGVGD
jgi:hypothetical protein